MSKRRNFAARSLDVVGVEVFGVVLVNMQRKLLASVAAGPLLLMASSALAETTITTAVTTPVTTATATAAGPDNLRITSDGSIKPTAAGPAVTVNSDNTFVNEGAISTTDVNDSIGVLVLGGHTGKVTNSLVIGLVDSYTATDTDGDGDLDGVVATGSGRYGIRVVGPGAFTGDIFNEGTINVRGSGAYGISVETDLAGSVRSINTLNVTGDGAYGVRTTGVVGSGVDLRGAITAIGKDTVGASIENDVGGQVHVQGSIIAYGYRYTTKPFLATTVAALDADDLYQGGSGLRITGNVGGGLLLDSPPPDLIADDANAATTTDSDEDGDGIADISEGSSSITVYGRAPAVLVGNDSRAITLGPAGAGDLAYGLVNKGDIAAEGVYDGVSATGLQIGGATGQSVLITNGVSNSGSISASGVEADATAVRLTAGARADAFVNSGAISAGVVAEGVFTSRGLSIEQGASVTSLTVGGSISAGVSGEKSSAIAIADLAGSLRTITNTGKISALIGATDDVNDKDDADTDPSNEVVTGRAIAMDLRASTGGVTITQSGVNDGDDGADGIADTDTDADGVDDADEPAIRGDILFGAHDDTLNVQNGAVFGAIAFGAGADTLNVSGGAKVTGAITNSDGRLAINLSNGTVSFTNAETVKLSSLTVGGAGQLLVIADPQAGASTKLQVSGAASLASGAQIGLTLNSLLDAPTRYTVIEAASLTAGTLNQNLLGSTPYLYVAQASADQAAGKVYVDVRQRTAAELGFSPSQTAAYSAVLSAMKKDTGVQSAVLSAGTQASLNSIYNQLTPDTGESAFAALQTADQLMSQATANRPDPHERYGPDSFWGEEINTLVRRDDGVTQGSDAQVFGFVGGYESMSTNGGALGLTLAYVNVEEHDSAAVVGENTTASVLQSGIYYRKSSGGFLFNAGGGGGYAWFDGKRRFIAPDFNADGAADVIRSNSATWNGATANAFAGVSYQAMAGRFYARPELRVDYVYLKEGERKETGGGAALDLTVQDRAGSNLSGEGAITFGANFGRDVWFRPEIRVGYRQTLAGELGDTTAQFSGGTPFTLVSDTQDDGALTLNVALRSGTAMSYVAVEAGAEARKKQKRYNVRLAGRVMF